MFFTGEVRSSPGAFNTIRRLVGSGTSPSSLKQTTQNRSTSHHSLKHQ